VKLKRVYVKHGRYYFVDTANKWHALSRVDEGESVLLRALAKRKDIHVARPGSMSELIRKWWERERPSYAESTQADYELMFPKIELAFEDFDVAEVTPADVDDFVRQWSEKPRQGNKYRHLMSMLFKFACAPLRLRTDNPCDQVGTLDEGPSRDRYITDREFYAIRRAAMVSKDKRKVPSGDIIVCAMDLAYLTFQRQFEIRTLRWSDIDDEWLYFKPAKSKSTTGAKVRWKRTPEIDAVLERARAFGKVKPIDGPVIHTLRGKPYSKRGFYTAWERACERAKVNDAHFHDLRAKAQTDAKARGFTMEQIQEGATHASPDTTRGYIKRREVVASEVTMSMPELDTGTES
jgi:integrase